MFVLTGDCARRSGKNLGVLRSVFGRTGIAVCLELVRRREVSSDTAVESTSDTLATSVSLEGALCLVASWTLASCGLTLVDHPHVLPFGSILSSRLLSDDGCSLIGLVRCRAWVLVRHELVGTGEVRMHPAVETTSSRLVAFILKGALEFVGTSGRILLGNSLLVDPDVFSFVSVLCSG